MVPADALTGGQQIKNAEYLASEGSAVVIRESELNNLLNKELRALLDSPAQRSALARSLHTQVPSNASVILAQTLLSIARGLDKS